MTSEIEMLNRGRGRYCCWYVSCMAFNTVVLPMRRMSYVVPRIFVVYNLCRFVFFTFLRYLRSKSQKFRAAVCRSLGILFSKNFRNPKRQHLDHLNWHLARYKLVLLLFYYHLNSDICLQDKRKCYRKFRTLCSVCCVQQLYTTVCAHTRNLCRKLLA